MRVEEKQIDQLIPADYNPRQDLQPGDPEYEKLKRSIEEFGYVEPIIWNEETGRVVGGHQRLKVMKDLGFETVQVSVVNLPESREKALNIALNKIEGRWDMEKLKDLLQEIDTGEFDITLTGFSEDELENLMATINIDDFFEEREDQADAQEEEEELICPHCGKAIER
mgnify:CR=1 FL=1